MGMPEEIPVEIRASVEANALFDCIRRGDFAGAARAQQRLIELGWYISREPKPQRRRKSAPSVEASPC
jgi:hypothetical protein